MYNQNSLLITLLLFAGLVVAIQAGYYLGRRSQDSFTESSRSHVNAIQASLLGVLALLLGFTFSLALQRYDSRSAALVDEANAIGTTYLRAELLPPLIRVRTQLLLRDYVDARIQEASIPLSRETERQAQLLIATTQQNALWRYALQAAVEDKSPVTSGLFIQALNEMIDSFGRRNDALTRHVPEVVLYLLFATFLLTWAIVGYSAGLAGHRVSLAAYIMLALVVLLIFIIIDLDRPRRGLIGINQSSLYQLQESIKLDLTGSSALPRPAESPAAAASSPQTGMALAIPLWVVVDVEDVILGRGPDAQIVQQPERLGAVVGAVIDHV